MRFGAINPLVIWFLTATACGLLPGAEPIAAKADPPDLFRIWSADKKIGFIDKTGQVVIEPQFNWAYEFSEGMCQVMMPGKEGYIDTTGKLVIEIDTHDDRPFRCGVAVVCTGKRTGILDREGRVIDCPVDWMEQFSEGLSAVYLYEKLKDAAPDAKAAWHWRQRKCGFVDTEGKLVISLQYTAAESFSEGLAPVYVGGSDTGCTGLQGGKWGYINREGEMVIKPQFNIARSFAEGLALVSLDGKSYGWIDRTGKFAIKMKRLSSARSFHDGVALIRGAVDSDPSWDDFGYVDKTGEIFTHENFRLAGEFSEGLAPCRERPTWNGREWAEGLYGYVNKRAEWVVKPQFTHANPFRGGLAFVQTAKQMSYVDRTGRVIWTADLAPK